MPRICHLITSLATGGAETTLFRLLTAPEPPQTSIAVICLTDEGTYGPRLRAVGIPVYTLEMKRGHFRIGAFFTLLRLLRQIKPDILQTWLYHSDLLGFLAARLSGVKHTVWNIRCSVTDERYVRGQAGKVLRILAALSGRPDAVVANSQAGIDVHTSLGYRPRRWVLIPNGIDLEAFRPDPEAYSSVRRELGLSDKALLVGHVARYDPLKDHATFLRAAAQAAAERPDLHFVGVGADVVPENVEIARLAGSLNLGGRLHLLGERRDIPRLNAAFDIAMCTSRGEGFPNMIVEAMACAVPCVSTDVGDAALLLEGCGLLAPVGDDAVLAEQIGRLADETPAYRRHMGRRARQRIEQDYSLRRMIARYDELYRSLAA